MADLNGWMANGRYKLLMGDSMNGGTCNFYRYPTGYATDGTGRVTIGSFSLTLVQNQWYTVRIIRKVDNFKIYVDDILRLDATDASPVYGTEFGLGTYDNISAEFDNVKIAPLNTVNTITDTFGGVQDDFNDADTNDWTSTGGTWNVTNGVVDGFGNGSPPENFYNITYNGFSGADLVYECKVKPVTSGGSRGKAIIFRYQDDNNYYMVDLEAWSQNYAEIGKRVGGSWTMLANTPFTFTSGQWYLFKVIMKGSTIEFYIDGTLMCKATDSSITNAGKIGFEIDYPDEHVYFDDPIVTPIGADKGDNQAPSVPGFYASDATDGSLSHNVSAWQSGISNDNTVDIGWLEPLSNGDDYFYYSTAVDSQGNETNLATNNGFENGSTGWGFSGGTSRITTNPSQGSYCISNSSDYSFASETAISIPNAVGRTFMFSADVKQSGGATILFYVYTGKGSDGGWQSFGSYSPGTEWSRINAVYTIANQGGAGADSIETLQFYRYNQTGTIYVDNVSFREFKPITVTTPIAGFWWAVNNSSPENNGTWISRTTNLLTTPALSDGTSNYIYVKSEDGAGNISSAKTFGPFYIDVTAPTIAAPVISSGTLGSNGWYTTDVSLYINSSDAASGIALEKHKSTGAYNDGSSNDTWTDSSEGIETWYGYAIDNAGNARDAQDLLEVKIDKTAPTITITSHTNDQLVYNNTGSITMGGTSQDSGGSGLNYTIWNSDGDFETGSYNSTYSKCTVWDGASGADNNWSGTWQTLAGKNRIYIANYDNAGIFSGWGYRVQCWTDSSAPAAPSTPTFGTINTTSIVLNWAVPSDNGSGTTPEDFTAGSPAIYVNTSGLGISDYTWTTNATNTFTGLTPNTQYGFRIKARDNNAETYGVWHNESAYTGWIYAYTLPVTPTITSVTPSTDQPLNSELGKMTINWSGDSTAYTLEYSTDQSNWTTLVDNQAVTTYTHTLLADNTTYYYRAKGRNPDNIWTTYSPVQSAATPDRTKPSTPGLGVAESNCVGYWSFDDTNNVARDYSAYGNNGTNSGATYTANGEIGGALSFDGVNDYVMVNSSAYMFNSGDFSVELWANPAVLDSSYDGLVSTDTTGDSAWKIFRDAGNNYFKARYGTTVANYPTVSTGVWHHYGYVKSGTNLILYLDGNLVSTNACPSTHAVSGTQLVLGSYRVQDAIDGYHIFNGLLDDVRIYNRVLSDAEVKAHYSSGLNYTQLSHSTSDGTGSSIAGYTYNRSASSNGTYEPVDGIYDDFSDGNYTTNPVWTVANGTWTAASNVLAKTETASTTGWYQGDIIAGDNAWTNYVLEADMQVNSGNYANIQFRRTSTSALYRFGFRNDSGTKVAILYNGNGDGNIVQSVTYNWSTGVNYHLKVICSGTNIRCFINEILIINATDATNSQGGIALGSYATTVQYDNIKVTPLNTGATSYDTFGGIADDFNDGDTAGWTSTSGTWSVSNNKLHGIGASQA
ncbi:MAG: LamG-like jellyroll fold domain-containing protein, partial [Candidatus Desantisbacteria bacterium]